MSGRKNVLPKFQLLTAQSMAASFSSRAVNVNYLDNTAFQYHINSGTPSGVLSVEVSVDHVEDSEGNIIVAGRWIPLIQPDGVTPVAITIAAGLPADGAFDINQTSFPYIRLTYTRTSGTGSMDAFTGAKML